MCCIKGICFVQMRIGIYAPSYLAYLITAATIIDYVTEQI